MHALDLRMHKSACGAPALVGHLVGEGPIGHGPRGVGGLQTPKSYIPWYSFTVTGNRIGVATGVGHGRIGGRVGALFILSSQVYHTTHSCIKAVLYYYNL